MEHPYKEAFLSLFKTRYTEATAVVVALNHAPATIVIVPPGTTRLFTAKDVATKSAALARISCKKLSGLCLEREFALLPPRKPVSTSKSICQYVLTGLMYENSASHATKTLLF